MVRKKIEKAIEDVKNEVNEVVESATEDVATFTIDRWHVVLAATVVTSVLLAVIL